MNRTYVLILLALAVIGAATAAPASFLAYAQSPVTNLRLVAHPDDTEPTDVFPTGTTVVHALFDYDVTVEQTITVVVEGRGGLTLQRTEGRYIGTGSAQVDITGSRFYAGMAGDVAQAAESARANARLATSGRGQQGYLGEVLAQVSNMQYALRLLAEMGLPAPQAVEVAAIQDARDTLADLVGRALALPEGDVDGRAALARQMDAPAAAAVVSAHALEGHAATVQEMPIPGTGNEPQAAYNVQVLVGQSPSASREFWVERAPTVVLLPWVNRAD